MAVQAFVKKCVFVSFSIKYKLKKIIQSDFVSSNEIVRKYILFHVR